MCRTALGLRRLIGVATPLILLSLLLTPLPLAADDWNYYQLTDNNWSDEKPDIAVDSSGNVHVVWDGGNVYYRRNLGAIESWAGQEPAIAVDASGVPHVAYVAVGKVYYKNRAGGSWSTPIPVGEPGTSPDIDVHNGVVHIVYKAGSSSSDDIIYTNSDNFSTKTVIYDGAYYSENGTMVEYYTPNIRIDSDGYFHIAVRHFYRQGPSPYSYKVAILHKYNSASGTQEESQEYNQNIPLDISKNALALTSSGREIFFSKQGNLYRFPNTDTGYDGLPAAAAAGSRVGVVFRTETGTIYYMEDSGSGFGTPVQLATDTYATQPVVALGSTSVCYAKSDGSDAELWLASDQTLPPWFTVRSDPASNVEETTATLNGYITDDGGINLWYRFDYDTDSGEPYSYTTEWACCKRTDDSFSENITGLEPGTKYYFRAKAANTYGADRTVASGDELTFTTKPYGPESLTPTGVWSNRIDLSWTKGEGAQKTMVRRADCNYPSHPFDAEQVYFGTGTSCSDTGLKLGQTYYYRAWSWVEGSDIWSDDFSSAQATTQKQPPTVTTKPATGVGPGSATLNMDYNLGEYSSVDVRFGYKKSSDSTWSYTSWVTKSASGSHSETLTGLTPGTQYDFKAQLKYDSTTIEGTTLHFFTGNPPDVPSLKNKSFYTKCSIKLYDWRCNKDIVITGGTLYITDQYGHKITGYWQPDVTPEGWPSLIPAKGFVGSFHREDGKVKNTPRLSLVLEAGSYCNYPTGSYVTYVLNGKIKWDKKADDVKSIKGTIYGWGEYGAEDPDESGAPSRGQFEGKFTATLMDGAIMPQAASAPAATPAAEVSPTQTVAIEVPNIKGDYPVTCSMKLYDWKCNKYDPVTGGTLHITTQGGHKIEGYWEPDAIPEGWPTLLPVKGYVGPLVKIDGKVKNTPRLSLILEAGTYCQYPSGSYVTYVLNAKVKWDKKADTVKSIKGTIYGWGEWGGNPDEPGYPKFGQYEGRFTATPPSP